MSAFRVIPEEPVACREVTLLVEVPAASYLWRVTAPQLGYAVQGEGASFRFRPCWEGKYQVLLTATRSGVEVVFRGMLEVLPLPERLLRPGDILYHPALYSTLFRGRPRSPSFPLGHMGIVTCDYRVLEAHLGGVRVRYSVDEFVANYRGEPVWVLRVRVPPEVRARALEFALEQVGKPYDFLFIDKEIFGRAFYCSELVWAAYEVGSGARQDPGGRVHCGAVNLDSGDEGGCTREPVSPEEVYRSPWTYAVGYLVPPLEFEDGIPIIHGP